VGGALIAAGLSERPDPPHLAAPTVMEVALIPASVQDPPNLMAPGPEQVETEPSESVQAPTPKAPPLDIPEKADGEVQTQRRPEPVKDQPEQKRVELASAPPRIAAPPAPVANAPVSGAASSADATAEQSWEGLVLAAFERKKRYPTAAQRLRQQDVVLVHVTIDRRGNVTNAVIRRSQGFTALDDEVLSLVRRVSPLPQPPANVAGEQIALTVPVQFFVRQGRP
jgi:protein TonB